MAEWLPWVVAAAGFLSAIAAVLKAFSDRKAASQAAIDTLRTHTNVLLDQYQEDRKADREELKTYSAKVDRALEALTIEREYSAILLAWGLAGSPPPPPTRRTPTAPLT